ncbi:MAG: family 20 glycosylhydrolase [Thermoanaerobaculia bacterium]|nr:family 20 glycosylhydrolase [Thermoanaerobaculia bacterium]
MCFDPSLLLVPRPKSVRRLDVSWRLEHEARIAGGSEAGEPAWRRLSGALGVIEQVESASDADIVFERTENADTCSESYHLRLDEGGVRIAARSAAGLAHGASTLAQWLHAHDSRRDVPGIEVDDRPDFVVRGFQLDVSRNRVPSMEELEQLIERLASLKFNQLQLYLEHAFAYRSHEAVWQGFDPLTPEEICVLASWCTERHIELVPNQNSFGHLHRWLIHEPYRRLAECPDGIVHPFSPDPEPFSLCPLDPGSLDLLRDLYGQLLPSFPKGPFFNVGFDETLDLGLGRSREACERLGKERIYLDFLNQVHGLAAEHGRRLLFWGDVVMEQPECLPDIPADAVALAWGYEADHDWDAVCGKLAAAKARTGLDFWVCPGTSSWNSFTGRTHNTLSNTARAAASARSHGADGYLLCDWGDHGHLQPPPVCLPGLVAGADTAWNTDLPTRDGMVEHRLTPGDLATFLDLHVLDEPLGGTVVELGDVHRLTGAESLNGSPLFFQLLFADRSFAERRSGGMTARGLTTTRERLAALRPPGTGTIARELAWAADMLDLGADLAEVRLQVGVDVPLRQLPSGERRRISARLEELLEKLGPLWTARSRLGGLEMSRERWRRALAGLS